MSACALNHSLVFQFISFFLLYLSPVAIHPSIHPPENDQDVGEHAQILYLLNYQFQMMVMRPRAKQQKTDSSLARVNWVSSLTHKAFS